VPSKKVWAGIVALLIIVGIFVVPALLEEAEEGGYTTEKPGFVWKERQRVIKDTSFTLGAKDEKDIIFPLEKGSEERHVRYEFKVNASDGVDVEVFKRNLDGDWVKADVWDDTTYASGDVPFSTQWVDADIKVAYRGVNPLAERDVTVKIVRHWEEKVF